MYLFRKPKKIAMKVKQKHFLEKWYLLSKRFLHDFNLYYFLISKTYTKYWYIPILCLIFSIPFHARGGFNYLTSSKVTFEFIFASKLQFQWSKSKHSWLWIWRPRVQIPEISTLSLKMKGWCSQDLNTGPLVPKAAMIAPRPPFYDNCLKTCRGPVICDSSKHLSTYSHLTLQLTLVK